MEITIVVQPMDPADEDDSTQTGLATEAADRLRTALWVAGFEVTEGPIRPDILTW